MAINYKPLWHLMIEKNMKKEDLKKVAGISGNCIARMGKNQYVNLESLEKICIALECKIEEIVEIKMENENDL